MTKPSTSRIPSLTAMMAMTKLSTDRILSLTAMAIGVGSLFVIGYQTHLMRQAQHAAVLPHLTIAISSNEQGAFFTVRNVGVGPARIEDVRVHHQGRGQVGDAYDFYVALRPERNTDTLSVDRITPGRFIPAGELVRMLGRGGAERAEMLRDLLELFEIAEVPRPWLAGLGLPASSDQRAVLEITYSSVFGHRWRVRSDRIAAEEL
jgi:hypothetical protein